MPAGAGLAMCAKASKWRRFVRVTARASASPSGSDPALPADLPLLALRSTIVFPAGTIAVQMGAPENLALLQANPEPGLLVALVVGLAISAPAGTRRSVARDSSASA